MCTFGYVVITTLVVRVGKDAVLNQRLYISQTYLNFSHRLYKRLDGGYNNSRKDMCTFGYVVITTLVVRVGKWPWLSI